MADPANNDHFLNTGAGTNKGLIEAMVAGPGTLALDGAASTVSAVTLSDTTLSHGGTGTLTLGGTVTLGGAKGATDTIGNAGGATVSLNTGTEAVASGVTGLFGNAGTLQKAGGGGLNTLGAALTNTGTVLARTGTLEITGAVGGTGTLAVKGGTLQLDAGPGSARRSRSRAPAGSRTAPRTCSSPLRCTDRCRRPACMVSASKGGHSLTSDRRTRLSGLRLMSAPR